MYERIAIRSIQHFMYCPHRWGLIEIDKAWAENYFVVKANLMHERVHKSGNYTKRGALSHTNVSVWSELWGIYGKLDCLEINSGSYSIIEYKPTQPKGEEFFREDDALQVFAQKICADEVFKCNCEAYMYYGDTKKRYRLPFDDLHMVYEKKLKLNLDKMRYYMNNGIIPPMEKGQKCSGCSLKDVCIPKSLKRTNKSVKTMILENLES